ncbi:diaminopropionate ammonia-lyase [Streptomyces sp. TRM49041]|uniref:diaminopropionate ammonia-lyase n=1 Tax=Streptomyces sp. TRM49041 TaxID=2603216 RepID=UPI001CA44579|nr:diaminopropionate ammonia-lyase [Streptomyces sp. TRM49041]
MMRSWLNTARDIYSPTERELVGLDHAASARAYFHRHPSYRPTPLRSLPALAGTAGVASIRLKDESARMGLSSFKALGGMYAVARLVRAEAQERHGPHATEEELRAVAARTPFICASAGNHGLSVTTAVRQLGGTVVVFLSEGVPEQFARGLRSLGAEVQRSGRDYEQSMAAAREATERHGWRLVSDSSWEGYTVVPLNVMRGYTVLFEEIEDRPTHIFVQAGVGGLAGAAAAYARDRWGERPRIVVVEPQAAPCLLVSAREGRPVRVEGGPTVLGRLDCREPSLLAWQLLSRLADAFVTVTDEEAEAAARLLAAEGVRVSACGAGGAAGLLALEPAVRTALGLGADARVLVIGTEGEL